MEAQIQHTRSNTVSRDLFRKIGPRHSVVSHESHRRSGETKNHVQHTWTLPPSGIRSGPLRAPENPPTYRITKTKVKNARHVECKLCQSKNKASQFTSTSGTRTVELFPFIQAPTFQAGKDWICLNSSSHKSSRRPKKTRSSSPAKT